MPVVENTVIITNKVGLHARPATLFVQSAARFQSHIQVYCGEKQANAKSIVSVLTLGASPSTTLVIRAEGDDASEAVQALVELVEDKFGEE